MRFSQIARHVLCNILETNHSINAKPTKSFIHTIIKLLVEKSICHGPNSLRSKINMMIIQLLGLNLRLCMYIILYFLLATMTVGLWELQACIFEASTA